MTPDREIVIKGLECHKDPCAPCAGCPYNDSKRDCAYSLCEDALELLKEQEPSKPKVSENAYGVKFYYCPRCERPILKSAAYGHPRYCEDCGKGLIWDG